VLKVWYRAQALATDKRIKQEEEERDDDDDDTDCAVGMQRVPGTKTTQHTKMLGTHFRRRTDI
jgi:hypothetical protein